MYMFNISFNFQQPSCSYKPWGEVRKVATPQAKVGSGSPQGLLGSPSPQKSEESRVRKTQAISSKHATPVKTPDKKKGKHEVNSDDVANRALSGALDATLPDGTAPADGVTCLKHLGPYMNVCTCVNILRNISNIETTWTFRCTSQ